MLLPIRTEAGADAYDVLPEWERAAEAILASPGVAVVLGASDTGKSTLTRWLGERCRAAGRHVAVVDADIGQSWLGPPTTVSLVRLLPGPFQPPALVPEAFEFVGVTSPPRRFLPHIQATETMVREGLARGAEIVLVDTTGLAVGPVAVALKRHKLRALRPRHVLALQRADEVTPILRLAEGQTTVQIHHLPVSSDVRPRTAIARRAYREARFRDYFAGAVRHAVPWRSLRFPGFRLGASPRLDRQALGRAAAALQAEPLYGEAAVDRALILVQGAAPPAARLAALPAALQVADPVVIDVAPLSGALLGLRGAQGRPLAVGLLDALDPGREQAHISATLADAGAIREIEVGRLRIEAGGRELGEVPRGSLG